MAVARQGYIDGTASSSSTTAGVDFSSRSAGELALVLLGRRGATTAPSSAPDGWSLVQSLTGNSAGYWLYSKVLAAGDLGTVTWTWAASAQCKAAALIYSGTDAETPIAASAAGTYSGLFAGYPIDCGSLTSSLPMLVLLGASYWGSGLTADTPEGYSEIVELGETNSDLFFVFADTAGAWAGGESAPDFTLSAQQSRRGGFQVALNEGATQQEITLAATSASAASLNRLCGRILSSTSPTLGVMARMGMRGLAAVSSPTGSLTRLASKLLIAPMSCSVGSIVLGRSYVAVLEAVSASVGYLGTHVFRFHTLLLAATSAATGTLGRAATRTLAGTSPVTGALGRLASKTLPASSPVTGALGRLASKTLPASSPVVASLAAAYRVAVSELRSGLCTIRRVFGRVALHQVRGGSCTTQDISAGEVKIR